MTSFSAPMPVPDDDEPAEVEPVKVDITKCALALAELKRLNMEIAALEDAARIQRGHIELELGDGEVGLIDGEPAVTWKHQVSKRIDVTKLKKKYPDVAAEFTVPSRSRRFLLVDPS